MMVGLLLLALCASLSYGQQCPQGYTLDAPSQTCFLVQSNQHSTFDDAQLNCQQLGGSLPVIHDNLTQAAVVRLSAAADRDYLWYIGMRRVTGNIFVWIDRTNVDYTAWQQGQPGQGLGLNCVSNFAQPGQTGWRVGPCTDTLPYICMYKPGAVTTTPAPSNPNVCLPPNYNNPTGVLLSPGFSSGQDYGDNLNCEYHITVQAGFFIMFTVNSFATESCCDTLTFYNAATATNQFDRWSGRKNAGVRTESNSNVATLVFSSDESVGDKGFSIQYTQTHEIIPTTTVPPPPQCPPQNYTGATGAIASPGYPGQYDNNMNCIYLITVVPNMAVQLTFDAFSTEEDYDTLSLFDGAGNLAPNIAVLSGDLPAGTSFTSTQNVMRCVFSSDSDTTSTGFHGTWATVIPPTTPPPPTRYPPTSPSVQCGADYFLEPVSNKCYHYEANPMAWAAARADCVSKGGDLLSIHSESIENFTVAYITTATGNLDRFYTWIGLMASGGQFQKWSDNTAVDYTRWETGQPNLSTGQCGAFQSWAAPDKPDGWRTLDCSYQRPYICLKNRIA